MDANTLITLVGSLGFPIVACIAMGWFFAKVNDNYRQDIKEIQTTHREETKTMTDAINNNTMVLQKLCDRLDDTEKEEK